MPTQTFWNLPEHKRQAILEIAIEEFADHDYNEASISRIVARAGIAKGSIYQYFTDKQELFLYLLDLSNQQRLDYLRTEPQPEPGMHFFALLRWQMAASTRAALAYPRLTQLFYRAILSTLPFQDEMLKRMKGMARNHLRQFVEQGIAQGDIAADVDPELAAVMLNGLFMEVGSVIMERIGLDPKQPQMSDLAKFNTSAVERIFDDVVRIVEQGLGNRSRAPEAGA